MNRDPGLTAAIDQACAAIQDALHHAHVDLNDRNQWNALAALIVILESSIPKQDATARIIISVLAEAIGEGP